MSGGVGNLVASGPLILAVPVALAAGAVTFLSPCCLPLVPGYLSYVTGMSGTNASQAAGVVPAALPGKGGATRESRAIRSADSGSDAGGSVVTVARQAAVPAADRSRVLAGAALFVLGFSALFASYGVLFGGLGAILLGHQQLLTRILGGVTILLGLMFAGVFDRFLVAGRIMRPSWRPRAGLADAGRGAVPDRDLRHRRPRRVPGVRLRARHRHPLPDRRVRLPPRRRRVRLRPAARPADHRDRRRHAGRRRAA